MPIKILSGLIEKESEALKNEMEIQIKINNAKIPIPIPKIFIDLVRISHSFAEQIKLFSQLTIKKMPDKRNVICRKFSNLP